MPKCTMIEYITVFNYHPGSSGRWCPPDESKRSNKDKPPAFPTTLRSESIMVGVGVNSCCLTPFSSQCLTKPIFESAGVYQQRSLTYLPRSPCQIHWVPPGGHVNCPNLCARSVVRLSVPRIEVGVRAWCIHDLLYPWSCDLARGGISLS